MFLRRFDVVVAYSQAERLMAPGLRYQKLLVQSAKHHQIPARKRERGGASSLFLDRIETALEVLEADLA